MFTTAPPETPMQTALAAVERALAIYHWPATLTPAEVYEAALWVVNRDRDRPFEDLTNHHAYETVRGYMIDRS